MKRAIIIGATPGIGKELAKLLLKNNYVVGAVGRRTHLLEKLTSENPNSLFVKMIDITDTEGTKEKLHELKKTNRWSRSANIELRNWRFE